MIGFIGRSKEAQSATERHEEFRQRLIAAYRRELKKVEHELPGLTHSEVVTLDDRPFPKSFTMSAPENVEHDGGTVTVRFGIEQLSDSASDKPPELLMEFSSPKDETSAGYKEMYVLDHRGTIGMATQSSETVSGVPPEMMLDRVLLVEQTVFPPPAPAHPKDGNNMTTALERAQSEVRRRNLEQTQEQAMHNKVLQLFETYTTWFDAQSADALEHISDFPAYPNLRGKRIPNGQTRWTFGKEPSTKEKPNLPIIAFFEYWDDESHTGSNSPQYTEGYLIYKNHIEWADSNGQTVYDQGIHDELTNQINAIVQTRSAGLPGPGKE